MVLKREDTRESEVFGTEEALAKISMELLSPMEKKLFTVTDVMPDFRYIKRPVKYSGCPRSSD